MRILLVALLALALAGLAVGPERPAFLAALLIMLLAFVLGAAKLAVDLIELVPADLVADAAMVVLLALAFTRVTTGDRLLVGALLAAALAAQAGPLVVRWRRVCID